MVFFSVLSFFALAFTVLFLVIWVIKAILKKKTKMWLAAIVSLVVAISSFIAFGVIHDSKQTDPSSPSEQVSATSFTAQPEEKSTTTTQPQTTKPTTTDTTTEPEKEESSKTGHHRLLLVLFLVSLLSTVICIFIWLVKLFLKADYKRVSIAVIISGVIMFVLLFILFGTYRWNNKKETQAATDTSTSIPAATESTPTEATTITEPTSTSPTTTTAPPTTTTTEATTTTKPKKTLSNYRFKSADLIGDAGNVIGSRGYVNMEWEVFDEASDKEIHEFLERAYFNRYDYVNIFFDNGAVLWSWGDEDMFQIGDMPNQGYGAVKLDENNSDGIQGQYTWIGSYYSHS